MTPPVYAREEWLAIIHALHVAADKYAANAEGVKHVVTDGGRLHRMFLGQAAQARALAVRAEEAV